MVPKRNTFLLKKRSNKRIKTCGGCKEGFANLSLDPPHDYCFATLEERYLRGEKAPDGKTMPVTVHYHIKRSCLKKTQFKENLVDYGDALLTDAHKNYFALSGISL